MMHPFKMPGLEDCKQKYRGLTRNEIRDFITHYYTFSHTIYALDAFDAIRIPDDTPEKLVGDLIMQHFENHKHVRCLNKICVSDFKI